MKTNEQIPVYPLNNLAEHHADIEDVFLLDHHIGQHKRPVGVPHRTNYYGIGLCVKGQAVLNANLETYTIVPGCLIAMSPHIIKRWEQISDDFQTLAILFTKDLIVTGNNAPFDKFAFFESMARHVFMLTPTESAMVQESLSTIRNKYAQEHRYRDGVLRSLINAVLFEVASFYEDYQTSFNLLQTRSQLVSSEFKSLVNEHFATERSVSFYADKLFITTGHLTETVREVTGKTPGEWIAGAVVLEACVLLQNPALSVAQIAGLLHFPEQSSFGKYFKNVTGTSPAAYRRQALLR